MSVISFLAGFGGKTWREGSEPAVERITPRGWIALVCLVIALGIGICKEIYTAKAQQRKDSDAEIAANQVKLDAQKQQNAMQQALDQTQQQLAVSEAKLEGLQAENQLIQDQLTGGKALPLMTIFPQFPSVDNSFPLVLTVLGQAPLYDLSYHVGEEPNKIRTPEELQKIATEAGRNLSTGSFPGLINVGTIFPGRATTQAYRIHPKTSGENLYQIDFDARNGTVEEMLGVRFDGTQHIWQFQYKIVSYRKADPKKVLAKQDWVPKKAMPIMIGDKPPIH